MAHDSEPHSTSRSPASVASPLPPPAVPSTTSPMPAIDSAMPSTPRRDVFSVPRIAPMMAMNAGVAGARTRHAHHEKELVHTVPEHPEREQRQDVAARRQRRAAERDDDEQ